MQLFRLAGWESRFQWDRKVTYGRHCAEDKLRLYAWPTLPEELSTSTMKHLKCECRISTTIMTMLWPRVRHRDRLMWVDQLWIRVNPIFYGQAMYLFISLAVLPAVSAQNHWVHVHTRSSYTPHRLFWLYRQSSIYQHECGLYSSQQNEPMRKCFQTNPKSCFASSLLCQILKILNFSLRTLQASSQQP